MRDVRLSLVMQGRALSGKIGSVPAYSQMKNQKGIDNQTESINLRLGVRTPRAVHLAKSGVHAGERARTEPTRTRCHAKGRTGWLGRHHRVMQRDP